MFKICRFSGNQMNVRNGRNLETETFAELADIFSKCIKGSKHERYFVRGALDPIYRVDANLLTSSIFIIDGDGTHKHPEALGAPDPFILHKLLVEHDINHFIYTTHSHDPSIEKNKFRCVIEVEPHSKPELKNLAAHIVGWCHVNDYPILHVKEMNTWSQPWFYPTRDDPDDGKFAFWAHTTGTSFKMVRQISHAEVEKIRDDVRHGEHTIEEYYEQIRSSETYHAPLLALSFQFVSDGMNKKLAMETLKAVMSSAKTQDKRWQERYDSIEGLVDGAIARVKSTSAKEEAEDEEQYDPNTIEELEISPDFVRIVPMPGLMGELFNYALSQQHLPSEVFAFASVMGVLAGICGRKFNVSNTGLNIEILVIARTGRGKDSIRRFITQTLYMLNENGAGSSFLAPARFTGPVAMYNAVKDSRSCVSVQTECGLIKSSEAGDSAGIIRYQLGLYSASGQHEVMGGEGYSSKENSIQALNSVAMSFIMESTAESFSTVFNSEKALTSGELPRVGIYRESDFIPEEVFGDKPPMPEAVKNKLAILANICSREQAKPTPDVFHMKIGNTEKIQKISARWRKVMNEEVDTQMLMATRNTLRTLKYAALAAAFNNEPGDDIIHDRELDWANRIVEAEFASIGVFFKRTIMPGNIHDVAKRAKQSIARSLSGRDKGTRHTPRQLALQSIMPVSVYKQVVMNVKAVRDLTDTKGGTKDGAQKLLDYYITNRYCSKPYKLLNPDSMRTVMMVKFLKEFETL